MKAGELYPRHLQDLYDWLQIAYCDASPRPFTECREALEGLTIYERQELAVMSFVGIKAQRGEPHLDKGFNRDDLDRALYGTEDRS